jgi:mannan endo-1,4-beta-mannosidase
LTKGSNFHKDPRNITKLRAGVAAVASTNRVYLADEYDWTSTSGDSLPSFLSAIEDEFKNSVLTGDKFWSLFGHNVGAPDGCNVFVNHTDGFTFHYGDASTLSNVTLEREEVRQHLWRLQGQEVGLAEPAVGCPGPEYESGTPS